MDFKRGINTKRALDLGHFADIQFVIISLSARNNKKHSKRYMNSGVIQHETIDFHACIGPDNKLKMDMLDGIKETMIKRTGASYELKRAWITFEGNDRLPIRKERHDELIGLVIPDDYDMGNFCFNMKMKDGYIS